MAKEELRFTEFLKDKKKYIQNMEQHLAVRLKKGRYRHTLGVAHTAACMAMKYGVDMDTAYLAGLLHDYAKNLSEENMLKTAKHYSLKLTDFEKKHPFIIHGAVAAALVKDKFGVDDEDILNSLRNHTTGRGGMSTLEKIVFLADYLEPGRNAAENLDKVRALAFYSIDGKDGCLLKVLKDTIAYLESTGGELDPGTKNTYDYYKRQWNL